MKDLPDLYRILQIDPGADSEVINAVYRSLARKYHPDVNPSADANRQMQEINMAYEILGNPKRRLEYDRYYLSRNGGYKHVSQKRPYSRPSERTRKHWYHADDIPSRPCLFSFPEVLEMGSVPRGARRSATITVKMTEGRKIRGRVVSNQSWIKIFSPKILHDVSEAKVEIVVDTARLRDGVSHFGSISIESLAYGSLTVPVTIHIQEEPKPQLCVEPRFIRFEAVKGAESEVVRTIHLYDEAGVPMSGSVHVKPNWLTTDVVDFEAVSELKIDLKADISNLRIGQSYSGRIEIHASNGRDTVIVKVTVLPQANPIPDLNDSQKWEAFISQLEASTEWEQSFLQTVSLQARQRGWKPSESQKAFLESLWRRRMEKNL